MGSRNEDINESIYWLSYFLEGDVKPYIKKQDYDEITSRLRHIYNLINEKES